MAACRLLQRMSNRRHSPLCREARPSPASPLVADGGTCAVTTAQPAFRTQESRVLRSRPPAKWVKVRCPPRRDHQSEYASQAAWDGSSVGPEGVSAFVSSLSTVVAMAHIAVLAHGHA